MIMYKDDPNIAFRFEGLGRAAFENCSKSRDPYGFAAQDVFSNFIEPIEIRGRRALSSFLQKIINDNYDYSADMQKPEVIRLLQLEKDVWEAETQEKIIEIISQSITEAESLGY